MKNLEIIKGGVTAPKGYKAAGVSCGIKKSKKKDLAIIYSEKNSVAFCSLTTNVVKAAPLQYNKEIISKSD
ncbi:MAG: bifunctional ornithine acetyltransferase/N-acetylglutamate synthase, partial [Actinomycetia bacterium]|nr:bifunctional ornithine acetyltransferase/N-acetylglutamate synthase [Actinomycetes bacterium]